MQTADRSGIICDKCGTIHTSDFIYYSYDLRQVHVYNDNKPDMSQVMSNRITISIDICALCHSDLQQKILNTVQKDMAPRLRRRVYTLCEICGKKLSGSYNCYYCTITKAEIHLSTGSYICGVCQNRQSTAKKCEKCGENKFIRLANVSQDQRILELFLCEAELAKLKTITKPPEWSTNS